MVRSASRVSTPAPQVLKQEIEFPPQQLSSDPSHDAPLSFWEQVNEVPDGQWASEGEKGYKVYLYEGQSGPYIALITQPFDIEWVKQQFGGGVFRAQLNDPSGKIVASQRFTVEGESKRKPPQNAQSPAAPPIAATDSFQAQMLDIMREGQRRQEDLIRQLMDRQTNPSPATVGQVDPTTVFRGMVEMFKEFMPAQKPMDLLETVSLLDKLRGPDLLTILKSAREAGLIPSAGASGGSLLTQFKELRETAEVMGLGDNKGKSLGEALIEKGPEILEAGGKLIDRYRSVEETRLQTARTVQQIQQRGAVVAAPADAAAVNPAAQHYVPHVQPPAPGAAPTLEVETPGSPAADSAIAEAERQDAFIKGKIVEAIANGDSGGDIIDFLDKIDKTICDRFSGASAEQIIYFFSSDPVLRKAAALPRFKPAITEMVEELNAPEEEIEQAKVVN